MAICVWEPLIGLGLELMTKSKAKFFCVTIPVAEKRVLQAVMNYKIISSISGLKCRFIDAFGEFLKVLAAFRINFSAILKNFLDFLVF